MTDSPPLKPAKWRSFAIFGVLLLAGYGITAGSVIWAEYVAESCSDQNAMIFLAAAGVYFAAVASLLALIRRVALVGLWVVALLVSGAAALLMTLLVLVAMGLSCPDPALEQTQNALESELQEFVESQPLGLTLEQGVETDCPRVMNVMCESVGSTVRFERTNSETDSCEAVWRLQQEHPVTRVAYGELEMGTVGQGFRAVASTPSDPRILSACQRLVARDRAFAVVMRIDVPGAEGEAFARISTGGDATPWEGGIVLAYTDYGTL